MEPTVAIPVSVAEEILGLAKRLLPFMTSSGPWAGTDEEAVDVPRQARWTRRMIEQLKKAVTRYPGAFAVLDAAAALPDEPVRLDTVAQDSGIPVRQIAAELGAMSKLARRLFGGRKIWPMEVWQGPDNISRYRMPRRVAEWWRESA